MYVGNIVCRWVSDTLAVSTGADGTVLEWILSETPAIPLLLLPPAAEHVRANGHAESGESVCQVSMFTPARLYACPVAHVCKGEA